MQENKIDEKNVVVSEQKEVRFGVQDLAPLAIIFVVAIVVIAFGAQIVADVQDDFTEGTAEYNTTTDGLTGLTKFSSKFGLIATIIVAAIIIGIIGRFLFLKMNN